MSLEQQNLRLQIENSKDVETILTKRRKRKSILKEMSKLAKKRKHEEMEKIVENIEKAPDDAKMFQAVKYVHRKTAENSFVHDKDGRCVTNKQSMYAIINGHFEEHFHKENVAAIEPYIGPARKLNNPFTTKEMTKTLMSMRNARATFDIPVELVKYAPEV